MMARYILQTVPYQYFGCYAYIPIMFFNYAYHLTKLLYCYKQFNKSPSNIEEKYASKSPSNIVLHIRSDSFYIINLRHIEN